MSKAALPQVTICIPVKNRAWCIRQLLEALENIEYQKHLLKVIFVDDYSTDGTYEIIYEWASKTSKKGFYDVRVIRARTNIPQARNICIKHMEGKYLLFWDSDVIPPPDLLRKMIKIMERDSKIGVIGADYVYDSSLGFKYKPVVNKETNAVYMGFTIIRREVFERIGGFNESLSVGEDTEFCIRVKEKSNYHVVWAPKPVLHLKRLEDVKILGTLRAWVSFNFKIRAKEYYTSFNKLPRFLKFRIIYWLLWPWVVLTITYLTFSDNFLYSLPMIAYVLASLCLLIGQRGILEGSRIWIKRIFTSEYSLILWSTQRTHKRYCSEIKTSQFMALFKLVLNHGKESS